MLEESCYDMGVLQVVQLQVAGVALRFVPESTQIKNALRVSSLLYNELICLLFFVCYVDRMNFMHSILGSY